MAVKASSMNFFVAMKNFRDEAWNEANIGCQNYSFCDNLDKNGILPTKDQLLSMYNNKSSLNSLLSTTGGIKLTEDYYWSSTGYYSRRYRVNISNGNVDGSGLNDFDKNHVRCILTSW